MLKNHLAIWSCPRSRSTALLRSFAQRNDCTVFDEPFVPAYVKLVAEPDYPYRDEIIAAYDCDVESIIDRLSAPLPEGAIAVQKHITRNILPQFGTSWYPEHSVVLIREPRDIVESLYRLRGRQVSPEHVGMGSLYHTFQRVREVSGSAPLVIHSDDLAERPQVTLTRICEKLSAPFSESMLKWNRGLADSGIGLAGGPKIEEEWYKSVSNSTSFYRKQEKLPLPDDLRWMVDDCLPVYEELLAHCERL